MSIHYIIARRATGRTSHAISWLLSDIEHRAIGVPNWAQRENLLRQIMILLKDNYEVGDELYRYLMKGDFIIVAGRRKPGQEPREVYIDNADEVLTQMFGNVVMANTTGTYELWHRESRYGGE